MVSKEFTVGRIGDTVEMNFDYCFTEFRAEVDDLNIPTALDCHASRLRRRRVPELIPSQGAEPDTPVSFQ
jgi:hypothetical protein